MTLQKVVLEELHREIGPDESQWWLLGIPKTVRIKVSQRFEEDEGKRGGREFYFDLIDYRQIVLHNWGLFESLLGYGKSGSKDKRTSWMNVLNDKRNIVAHASSAITLTVEELSQLEEYDRWLAAQMAGNENSEHSEDTEKSE